MSITSFERSCSLHRETGESSDSFASMLFIPTRKSGRLTRRSNRNGHHPRLRETSELPGLAGGVWLVVSGSLAVRSCVSPYRIHLCPGLAGGVWLVVSGSLAVRSCVSPYRIHLCPGLAGGVWLVVSGSLAVRSCVSPYRIHLCP